MTASTPDIWARWLLHRRHGGDPQRLKAALDRLYPVRDRVLTHAQLCDGGTLLDVGCGDGLIAFGALQRNPTSRVIFSDISQDLLDHAASLAREAQVAHRCRFVCASADDLSAVPDVSVDAVTTRSVLIYVRDKQQAINEFHRVLKVDGRLSVFEPINRFGEPQPAHMFWGFDATPVMEIAAKVKAVYQRIQPLNADPMMNFDERDLITNVEAAGFREIHLDLEAEIKPLSQVEGWTMTWDSFVRMAANPRLPTLEEAMAQALTGDEAARFRAHMRPLVENQVGTHRSAVAYLFARK
jgi:ubiquinone/menaquinone biosynthesis C-methylase UbiE